VLRAVFSEIDRDDGGGAMQCPVCGANVPEGARFCPECGASIAPPDATPAEPTATEPTAPVEPPATVAAPTPPAVEPTAPVAAPDYASPPAAAPVYAPPSAVAPAKKSRKGLIIGIVLGVLFLCLVCGGIGAVLALRGWSTTGITETTGTTPTSTAPTTPDTSVDDAAIASAAAVVKDFYAAINAVDLEKIKALVTEDMRVGVAPGAFEGWETTTFEFTRGWIEGDSAYVIGRESIQQYGAGDNGGVKFTLVRDGDGWLISGWLPVDTAQVEGQDTTGMSTGIPGPLSEAVARDLVTQLLEARKIGAGNVVRRLATKKFLTDNGEVWLDGIDNSETFTAFSITSVSISGQTASVVVTEQWPEGDLPTTYGLVVESGNVLVDTWQPE
jgi:hypothetical protein